MNYEEAIISEIETREANKINFKVNTMTDELLHSEHQRIKNESEPQIIERVKELEANLNHLSENLMRQHNRIGFINDDLRHIKGKRSEPKDYHFFQAYASVALLLGIVNICALACFIVGM